MRSVRHDDETKSAPHADGAGRAGSRLDLALGLGSVVVAAVTAYLILADVSLFYRDEAARKPTGTAVASLSSLTNVVRLKGGQVPVWNPAAPAEQLYENDYVFTDADSSVRLNFAGDGVLELGQNTLVAIGQSGETPALDLVRGSLRVEGGAVPVVVKVGAKGVTVRADSSSTMNVSIASDGEAHVAVLKGHATLEQAGQTVALGERDVGAVSERGGPQREAPLTIALASPAHGATVVLDAEGRATFRWQVKGQVDALLFELARDESFAELLVEQKVSGGSLAVPHLVPGTFFWRVRDSQSPIRAAAESRKVLLVSAEPPVLLSPSDGKTFHADYAAAVALDWQARPDATGYEVELAADQDFHSTLWREATDRPRALTPPLGVGRYFWRVRLSRGEGARFSAARGFSVDEESAARLDQEMKTESAVSETVATDAVETPDLPASSEPLLPAEPEPIAESTMSLAAKRPRPVSEAVPAPVSEPVSESAHASVSESARELAHPSASEPENGAVDAAISEPEQEAVTAPAEEQAEEPEEKPAEKPTEEPANEPEAERPWRVALALRPTLYRYKASGSEPAMAVNGTMFNSWRADLSFRYGVWDFALILERAATQLFADRPRDGAGQHPLKLEPVTGRLVTRRRWLLGPSEIAAGLGLQGASLPRFSRQSGNVLSRYHDSLHGILAELALCWPWPSTPWGLEVTIDYTELLGDDRHELKRGTEFAGDLMTVRRAPGSPWSFRAGLQTELGRYRFSAKDGEQGQVDFRRNALALGFGWSW